MSTVMCVCVCYDHRFRQGHSLNLWPRQNPIEIKTKERGGTLEKYRFFNLTIFKILFAFEAKVHIPVGKLTRSKLTTK